VPGMHPQPTARREPWLKPIELTGILREAEASRSLRKSKVGGIRLNATSSCGGQRAALLSPFSAPISAGAFNRLFVLSAWTNGAYGCGAGTLVSVAGCAGFEGDGFSFNGVASGVSVTIGCCTTTTP